MHKTTPLTHDDVYHPLTERTHNSRISFSTKVVSIVTCGSFLFGYNLGVVNSCMRPIALHFEWCGNHYQSSCSLSHLYQAMINSIIFLGGLIGALCSRIVLRNSRKNGLLCGFYCFLLGASIALVSNGAYTLILSRFISGIGLGLVTVLVPIFIAEMTPTSQRGYQGMKHQVLISIGVLFSIALGIPQQSYFDENPEIALTALDRLWWRFLLGFSAIPAIAGILGFCWLLPQDSPIGSLLNNRLKEATITMREIYGDSEASTQIEERVVALKIDVHEGQQLAAGISLLQAFREPYYARGLWVGLTLAVLQQLSGINVVVSASNDMFARIGLNSAHVTVASTVVAACNAGVTLVSAPLIESKGRRFLLLIGLALEGVSLLCISSLTSFSPSWISSLWVEVLSITSCMVFVGSFAFSLGPVVWIYLSEIYPVEIREKALSLCGMLNWITAFFVVFSANFLSLQTSFLTYGSICVLGSFFCYYFVKETRGSSVEDNPFSPKLMRCGSPLIQHVLHTSPKISKEQIRAELRASLILSSPIFKPLPPPLHEGMTILREELMSGISGPFSPTSCCTSENEFTTKSENTRNECSDIFQQLSNLQSTAPSSAVHTPPR